MAYWYLLCEDRPRSATWNMACDQHLLELVEAGTIDAPVLRLYAWERPTLSLGYHQQWQATVDKDALAEYGVDLVRRWTGGRAVLHDPNEITYSVIAPLNEPFRARVTHNYRLIGTALERFTHLDHVRGSMTQTQDDVAEVRGKRHLPCFASLSQSEIESQGQKLIGSAQKLAKNGFLQHGSIPMVHRHEVLQRVTATYQDVSMLMRGIYDLYQDAGLPQPSRQALELKLQAAFADIFNITFKPLGELGLPQEDQVRRLATDRFASDAWTYRK